MKFRLKIRRCASPADEPYWQEFSYEGEPADSVAAALRELNSRVPLRDVSGREADPVAWDCGCCAGKCGACAMRVNGRPVLACKAFLGDAGGSVVLEPLSKFPLVRDLIVDRSVIFDSLRDIRLWLNERAPFDERAHELRYQSSRCLMCGCCLEVCPNFSPKNGFTGAALAVAAFKLLDQEQDKTHRRDEARGYAQAFYSGCGTSLACGNVCPAGIPVTELISRSNAAAVWRRF